MDENEKSAAFVASLGTEYFVLQGAANATIGESSSRSSMFLLCLSSGVVSLGFVLGASESVFLPFAAAVLPTIFILGIFTIVRLVDTSVQNVAALRGMARIRAFYSELTPEAPAYFSTSGSEVQDAQRMLGIRYRATSLFFTMASTIGAVNSLLGGTIAGLGIFTVSSGNGPLAIIAAALVAVALFATCLVYQRHRFARDL
ncbi:hypothetical protein IWX81_002819 [Salinibacterium sp. CAN_S4]|uniref:hypothetical protein n=1 Tax=Salinibacterium sp. CAN_S4 TaxID=2787727 RepID=UPI0018EFBC17